MIWKILTVILAVSVAVLIAVLVKIRAQLRDINEQLDFLYSRNSCIMEPSEKEKFTGPTEAVDR